MKACSDDVTLFLCGDVMLGRGIDQILPHPCDPRIYESYCKSALDYVELAERINGAIPRPADYAYPWGQALEALDESEPDLRIINLETSITADGQPWPKGINYRMHPGNVGCLTAAEIDCCVLANNHVLDWGHDGLAETLRALAEAGIAYAGAGLNSAKASSPAVLPVGEAGRALVFGRALASSGVPDEWAAGEDAAGVYLLPDLGSSTAAQLIGHMQAIRRDGDIAIASIHWGGNWGYYVTPAERDFAQHLIDGGFDLVHGHSSHHPKGIEIYRDKLILYGCGDFINDYEGISGHEQFRPDLGVMYLPQLARASGRLVGLRMAPFRMRNFHLSGATEEELNWLTNLLDSKSAGWGTRVLRQGPMMTAHTA
ncbi:MAG: CapA family protein [Acetobacteraceae bacterium]|nr:CapA family protein [Acetobacteraceae bacterium]